MDRSSPLNTATQDAGPADQATHADATVTIVIPAHNEADSIVATVESCFRQTYPIDQVIVVADNCTDETAKLAEEAGARVIEGSGGSKAAAQNLALPLVESDIVLAVDADVTMAPEATARMVDTLRTGVAGTCAAALPNDTATPYSQYRMLYHAVANRWMRPLQDVLGRQLVLSGMANCHRTDVLREMGGFPDDIITEDFNLTWALHRADHRVAFTPDAAVFVQEPVSLRELVSQTHRWTAGFAQSMVKHRTPFLDWRSLVVVGSQVWDAAFGGLAAITMIPFFLYHGLGGAWQWLGLMWVFFMAVMLATAIREVGVRTTLKCLPAWFALQTLISALTTWWLIREWVLGRHLVTWTGRHGCSAQLTKVTWGRTAFLSSVAVLTILLLVLAPNLP